MEFINKIKIPLLLFSGMAIFGSGTPISKIVGEAFPIYAGSFFRVLIGFVILLPFLINERKLIGKISRKSWLLLGIISLVGVFLFSIFMLEGMKRVSGVTGSIIMSTTPAITALGAFIFYTESFGLKKIIALILAFGGVLIINLTHGMDNADISTATLILGSAMIFGAVLGEVCFTLIGKKITEDISPIMITGITCAVSSVLFLPFAFSGITSVNYSSIGISHFAALLWWGGGTMALGTIVWYSGITHAKAGQAAIYMAVMPISALVLSYILLGEEFKWTHALGFGIVLASVFLSTHDKRSSE